MTSNARIDIVEVINEYPADFLYPPRTANEVIVQRKLKESPALYWKERIDRGSRGRDEGVPTLPRDVPSVVSRRETRQEKRKGKGKGKRQHRQVGVGPSLSQTKYWIKSKSIPS